MNSHNNFLIGAAATMLAFGAGCLPKTNWYQDADGDGYGNPAVVLRAAVQPAGYVADNTDCDDADGGNYPGNSELFDARDNDCDAQADNGLSGRYVSKAGVDSGACASVATACQSVNYAVSQASSGDYVYVAAGTYAEMVSVDKSLKFHGANLGRAAGVDAVARGAETVVKGFRSPGEPHPSAAYEFAVMIDGFTLDPQGDAQLLAASTRHLVSLFGGDAVIVRNNIFVGGAWDADCDATCTTMMDSAFMVQSGAFELAHNSFTSFRRPVDIAQDLANLAPGGAPSHPITDGSVHHNVFSQVTSRAVWLVDWSTPRTFSGISVTDNEFDAGGATEFPGGVIVTTGGNVISNNSFNGFGSGVFAQVCDGVNNPANLPNTFEGNDFTLNRSGIQYYVVSNALCPGPVSDVINNNDFTGNIGFAVRWNGDTAPNVLDASCNWWNSAAGPQLNTGGTADCPSGDCVTPNVDYTPWNSSADGACDGGI